jgi:spore coat protein U-like protein
MSIAGSRLFRNAIRLGAAIALAAIASSVHAQAYSCVLSAASIDVAFGAYDPVSLTPRTTNASITLTCTHQSGGAQQVNWAMELSNGSSGTCSGASGRTLRRVGSPTDMIGYNIYQGSLGGGVWGNVGCGTFPSGSFNVTPGGPGRIRSVSQTLFGQIPINQFAPAGSYTDPLVLTISF